MSDQRNGSVEAATIGIGDGSNSNAEMALDGFCYFLLNPDGVEQHSLNGDCERDAEALVASPGSNKSVEQCLSRDLSVCYIGCALYVCICASVHL